MNNENENNQKAYYIELLENIKFEKFELRLMGITFIEEIEKLEEAIADLGIDDYDENKELSEYGLALGKIGSMKEPSWALFETDLSFQYVLDVKDGVGFYKVIEELEGIKQTVFNKVYLREESLLEDLQYYINLKENSVSAPIGESEYLS